MKKTQIIALISIFIIKMANAQDYHDALRFSQFNYMSTARTAAMGGAFTALGGDFGSITLNPAGVGVYRGNEFTFTPSFSSATTNSDFNGSKMNDFKYTPLLNNIGAVFTFNTGNTEDWISSNLAIGYNKIANFNNRISVSGKNDNSTILDNITQYDPIQNTYGIDGKTIDQLDPYYEWPAYQSHLIDTFQNGKQYAGNVNPPVLQTDNRVMSGSLGEYIIAFGGNYNNQLYLGCSMSIVSGHYDITSDYYENTIGAQSTGFNSLHLNRTWSDGIAGFNFKVGVIYKPVDYLRIGIAIHSPTFFSVDESFNSSMNSVFSYESFSGYPQDENGNALGEQRYSYSLTTPARYQLGVAGVINKMVILSADYEYVDYSKMQFESSDYDYNINGQNPDIAKYIQGVSNIRLGTEVRLGSIYARGGFGLSGNPYTDKTYDGNTLMNSYSLGLGYRENSFFIDVACVYQTYKDEQRFYSINMPTSAYNIYDPKYSNEYSLMQIMTTIGFRF